MNAKELNRREAFAHRSSDVSAENMPDRDYELRNVYREAQVSWVCPNWAKWLLGGLIVWWLTSVLSQAIPAMIEGAMQ
jgi:hypothetical protein